MIDGKIENLSTCEMSSSPPPIQNGELFQHGLHHLLQHNSNTVYPQDQVDEGIHLQSQYGSPATTHEDIYAYQSSQSRFQYQHQHHDSGLGLSYDGYHQDQHASPYNDNYSTPADSPLSASEMLRTRSGLQIQRGHQPLRPMPEGRSRIEKPSRPKKTKKDKVKAEKKVAKLDKPLSELTKGWTHVPVVDIEAYVNRSADERRKEVEEGKIPGKVKRPMNSFMLYRKAYQNRTKDWCLQNNHQVVSQVCGDSWPLEPEEIKEQFSEWARIERINHQNAHPGYKFSPTKPGAVKAGKRKWTDEPTSEESDLDDFEWRECSSKKSRKDKHQRVSKPDLQPVVYPSTKSAYQYSRENSVEPSHMVYNRSSYQINNPGRPLPSPYNHADLYPGEYYQQVVQNHANLLGVEDVLIKKATGPRMHSYLGIPGGGAQEYGVAQGMSHYPGHHPETRIDPSLITPDHALYAASYCDGGHPNLYLGSGQNGHHNWQTPYVANEHGHGHDQIMPFLDPDLGQEGSQIQDPHAHVLKGHQDGWQVDSLDAGGEFDKWMDGE